MLFVSLCLGKRRWYFLPLVWDGTLLSFTFVRFAWRYMHSNLLIPIIGDRYREWNLFCILVVGNPPVRRRGPLFMRYTGIYICRLKFVGNVSDTIKVVCYTSVESLPVSPLLVRLLQLFYACPPPSSTCYYYSGSSCCVGHRISCISLALGRCLFFYLPLRISPLTTSKQKKGGSGVSF